MNNISKLRQMLGLSRMQMQKLYGISASSLERWEKGARPSPSNCKKIIQLAKTAGITCSYDWLIYANGPGPSYKNSNPPPHDIKNVFDRLADNKLVLYEVPDDSMLPKYRKGSWLIAEQTSLDIKEGIYLIDTKEHKYIRSVKLTSSPGLYDLLTTNYVPNLPNHYNQEILAVARIIYLQL